MEGSHERIFKEDPITLPKRITGHPNEAAVVIEGLRCQCLIDTESMVSTISEMFLKENLSCPTKPLGDLLRVHGPVGNLLPYSGYVELNIGVPVQDSIIELGNFPFLVFPETRYSKDTPILLGTNILSSLTDKVKSMRKNSASQLHSSLELGVRMCSLRAKHLSKSDGVYGLVKLNQQITLEPGQSRIVESRTQVAVPIVRSIALVQQALHNSAADVQVTPALVDFSRTPGVVNL